MTEGRQPAVTLDGAELTEPSPGDVLEEDALDRVLGAERQDLLDGWLDQHGPESSQ